MPKKKRLLRKQSQLQICEGLSCGQGIRHVLQVPRGKPETMEGRTGHSSGPQREPCTDQRCPRMTRIASAQEE